MIIYSHEQRLTEIIACLSLASYLALDATTNRSKENNDNYTTDVSGRK